MRDRTPHPIPLPKGEGAHFDAATVHANSLHWSVISACSGKLARRDLRSRRLMHRPVRDIGDPGLLVDHRQSPDLSVGACEMIEPGHRAIVDIEGEALLRQAAKRKPERRLD